MKRTILCIIAVLIAMAAQAEKLELRLLNHWDNPDGTVERGYAGRSIWKWDLIPTGKKQMPDSLAQRYEEYGRINHEFGINGTVLNNVNAKPLMLTSDMIRKTAKIAQILRKHGIKVYLSVNFATPKALGQTKLTKYINSSPTLVVSSSKPTARESLDLWIMDARTWMEPTCWRRHSSLMAAS